MKLENQNELLKRDIDGVKVELLKHPNEDDWKLCHTCTLNTVSKVSSGKAPSMEWRKKLIRSMHSPIRTLNFCFRITNLPYWVSVHLARHVHAIPFVSTQRNDRQNHKEEGYDRRKAPQDEPVSMCWYLNAEELINVAHKRLCSQASKETRDVVEAICSLVVESNPEFEGVLVPNCIYRGGRCDEFFPCNVRKTYVPEE